METGDIYFADKSYGVLTFPIGSLPAVQDIGKSVRIMPLSRVDVLLAYRIKGKRVSAMNDALRYCFSQYSGMSFPLVKKSWFLRAKPISNCEMLYWYLHRISSSFEFLLMHTDPKKFSRIEILKFISENPDKFEKVLGS